MKPTKNVGIVIFVFLRPQSREIGFLNPVHP